MIARITPGSFIRRTRLSVAAGESPTSRASSTLGRSASTCSSFSSRTSISSSETAIGRNNISSKRQLANPAQVSAIDADNRIVMKKLRRHSALVALRRRPPLGAHRAAVQARPGLARRRLADRRALRDRRAAARPRRTQAPARRVHAARSSLAGAVGYGVVIVLQNAGIERTSVSHAALIVGAVPALVALIAVATGRGEHRPGRVGRLRARARRRRDRRRRRRGRRDRSAATRSSCCRSRSRATFVVVQPSLLAGRDPIAVTAVQMIARRARGDPERARSRASRARPRAPRP